jgi:hypothetical protein
MAASTTLKVRSTSPSLKVFSSLEGRKKRVLQNARKRVSGRRRRNVIGRRPDNLINWETGIGNANANEVRRLTYTAIAVTVGGLYTAAFNSTYMRANAYEWTEYEDRYAEYRVLAIRLRAMGTEAANPTPATQIMCDDRLGTLALVNSSDHFACCNAQPFPVYVSTPRMPVHEVHALDLEDFNFGSTGAANDRFALLWHVDTHSAEDQVDLVFFVEWLVEFKGPQ